MSDALSPEQVALVTGAGSGLGEATARAFANAGYAVACLDINHSAASRVVSEIEAVAGGMAIGCDVGDAVSVFGAAEAITGRWDRIDVAVNCAGIDHTLSVEEMTVDQWDAIIATNLRGPFLVAKAVLPIMRRQRGGHIVNVASTAAVRVWSNAAAYPASKFGLVGFSRGLGVEGRNDGIRVTTVIPGGMNTSFFDRFVDQGIPMPDPNGLQDPAVVAQTILYAVRMPSGSVVQEIVVTHPCEPSWP
jgi:NAD(P)-dependent dehydrogenase (short-subunit alcohol dehydrogenase family)